MVVEKKSKKCLPKKKMTSLPTLLFSAGFFLVLASQGEARILTQCEAALALQRAGISRSLISNFVCLMQNESGMNTALVTGPKTMSSYSFGVFQINSHKWCVRGRKGGICNKRCEDFANDDISDDIVCAKMILDREGFKNWDGWTKKCKNKPLPNVSNCKRRRRSADDETPSE